MNKGGEAYLVAGRGVELSGIPEVSATLDTSAKTVTVKNGIPPGRREAGTDKHGFSLRAGEGKKRLLCVLQEEPGNFLRAYPVRFRDFVILASVVSLLEYF